MSVLALDGDTSVLGSQCTYVYPIPLPKAPCRLLSGAYLERNDPKNAMAKQQQGVNSSRIQP